MTIKKVDILMIDCQVDFCSPNGNLFVPGAVGDMQRLSAFIEKHKKNINDIHATLDEHHLIDIAHPAFWKDSKGNNPNPFTLISVKDVQDGVWIPVVPSLTRRAIDYLKALDASGRYPHLIWPPHCLIGTVGASLVPEIGRALNAWSVDNMATVDFVSKGSNPFTEHFSGVMAEVPDPTDPSTQLNTRLIQALEECDEIVLAGEASSHCVFNTCNDIVNNFSDTSYVAKFTILKDCMSAVAGFEKQAEDFLNNMASKGARVINSTDF
jgi:nicotinamidase/pyrazinamidase